MNATALAVIAMIAGVFILVHRERRFNRVRLWTVGWLLVLLDFAAHFVRLEAPDASPWLSDLALCSLLLGSACFLVGLTSADGKREAATQWILLSLPLAVFALTTLHAFDAPWLQVACVLVAVYGPVLAILRSQGALALHAAALSVALTVLGPWFVLQVFREERTLPLVAGLAAIFLLCAIGTWHRYRRFTVGVVTLSLGFLGWAASLLYAFHGGMDLRTLDMPAHIWHLPVFLVGIGLIVLTLEERSQGHLALEAKLRSLNLELEQLSLSDTLTNAQNRRYFHANIRRDIDKSLRSHADGAPAGSVRDVLFLIIDLDHFKQVNDTYGHAAGDEVLVEVTARLRNVVRSSDMVIRWGGEEFLVVASPSSREQGPQKAERILQMISGRPFELTEGSVRLTCSVGWAAFPWFPDLPSEVSYEEVLQLADRALYAAKDEGRNRAVGFIAAGSPPPLETLGQPHVLDEFKIEQRHSPGPSPAASVANSDAYRETEASSEPLGKLATR